MKAVILAAGNSTRTYPLTLTRPKALLPIANKPLLAYTLEQVADLVDEVILIVGYRKEMIRAAFGEQFRGLPLTYVEQKEQKGTGHAIQQVADLVSGRFLVMNGDDLYHREDIERCLSHQFCVLGQEVAEPWKFGIFHTNNGILERIVEKPKVAGKGLANTGLYLLDDRIFGFDLKKTERGEYEITDLVNQFCKEEQVNIETVRTYWLPVSYPWSLLDANHTLLGRLEGQEIHGAVEAGATISGPVKIGKGTVIRAGSYISGPVMIGENCVIGPQAYIRPYTSIGDGCEIRAEVVDSVIMKNTRAKHVSYIGYSVIGENVNWAGGTITADYRHDGGSHTSLVRGVKVDTQRRKLGAFVGDNVRTGINTSIYPGRKIWPGRTTLPGEVVDRDMVG